MIDEKGRLFGKVNIVDLIIVIIVLAAAVFIGMRLFGPESEIANTQNVRITMFCEETPDFVADQLEAGSEAWDAENQVTLGTLVDWTLGDSKSAVTGMSLDVIISGGEPALGSSQGVFLAEFVGGGKERPYLIKCI